MNSTQASQILRSPAAPNKRMAAQTRRIGPLRERPSYQVAAIAWQSSRGSWERDVRAYKNNPLPARTEVTPSSAARGNTGAPEGRL